jgi:serine/threonine protein kinase
MKPANILVSKG